jgi:hypothetical protein
LSATGRKSFPRWRDWRGVPDLGVPQKKFNESQIQVIELNAKPAYI